MPYDDEDLEQLLANGRLSGRAYDRIEARVMERVAPRARVTRYQWLLAAALPFAALGGLAIYFGVSSARPTEVGGFTAKGEATALAGAVELRCSAERACRAGDTLMFLVDSRIVHGYLSAIAQRVVPPSPERVRFFPTEGGDSPRVESGSGMLVVSQGVRLGASLGPGVYRVDVRWTDTAPAAGVSAGQGTSVELKIDE